MEAVNVNPVVEALDKCETIEDALRTSGELSGYTAQMARIEYIAAVSPSGKRAVTGFFEPTYANVALKFARLWMARLNGSPRLKPGDFNLKLHPKPRREAPDV